MSEFVLRGAKGGASSSPTQSPDTLSSVTYAQMLDLISEGPIQGPPSGVVAQSVYLNGVPLQNADGSNNFDIDNFDFRYGTVDQSYIPGFATSQQPFSVGVALKAVTPWNCTITDLTTNAIIITLGVSALSNTDPSSGNVGGYTVNYQIQLSVDGGAFSPVVSTAFSGKASSAYQRSHTIPLSGASHSYQIRVVRTTADTTSVYIQDTTTVVSYSLVIDAKLRYPYSAVAALSVNAVQFSSVPTRSYDLEGLLVSVPSNYNPVTRVYSGTWDGTFKQAWTNNPAWIFYDLVLNNRYGAGQWVTAGMVDRYALYQIAQYCDVMVSDGQGGQEPRFTCNCYIQTRADCFKVLQDLAAVFRGMAYWGAGAVVASADMPSDPVYVYTAANVVGGQFKYVGSALKSRYTAAAVTWNNPERSYQQDVEYVQDADGVTRYGINPAQITAFGTTSRGQAQRIGQWIILTSRYETNTVTFSVGLDGALAMPGQIIAIADASRAGFRMAGRLSAAASTTQVTLDNPMPQATVGDKLTVILPSGVSASSTISAVDSTFRQVTVGSPFSAEPVPGAVWMIESATVESQLFRVVSVAEKDGITFDITATQYEPAKYAAIDDGAVFTPRPTVGNSFTTQVPPTNVTCSQYIVTDQGIAKTNLTISWTAAANATSYRVQWQKDNGVWVDAGVTGQCSLDITNVYSGNYIARVSATNGTGITSVFALSSLTSILGKTGAPPTVANLAASTTVPGTINLSWAFPAGVGDTAYTEIWQSTTPHFANATSLGIYRYPMNTTSLYGLAAGVSLFFWARLVDTTGNIGAWYPSSASAGVNGQSGSDASTILSYLTGQITSSQLGQALLTPINSIPGLSTSIATVSTSVSSLSSSVSSSNSGFNSQLSTINSTVSSVQSSVSTNASTIVANAASTSASISSLSTTVSTASTSVASQLSTVTANISTNTAAISSEQSARASGDAANAASISTLVATVNTNSTSASTAISNEASTRASADSANASSISALSTSFSSSLSTTNANLTSEQTARASGDSANASSITALSTSLSSSLSTTNANLTSEQSARSSGDSANASSINALSTSVSSSLSSTNASIANEATTRSAADSALSSQVQQLQAVTFVPMAGDSTTTDPGAMAGDTTVYAGIWSEQTARANADAALATSVSVLSTSFVNGLSSANASITQEQTTRAAADSANASAITTVSSNLSTTNATVQTNYNTYVNFAGSVNASYTIKTQVSANGRVYMAGIGVGVNAGGGTVTSSVLVAASQFSVIDPNGNASDVAPFVIQGGQTFINQALIGTAWITSAMIGQTIQATTNGANGQPLWILDKGGGLTMNGPNGGSGYLNLNSSTLTVYDNNGTLRVRLGLF